MENDGVSPYPALPPAGGGQGACPVRQMKTGSPGRTASLVRGARETHGNCCNICLHLRKKIKWNIRERRGRIGGESFSQNHFSRPKTTKRYLRKPKQCAQKWQSKAALCLKMNKPCWRVTRPGNGVPYQTGKKKPEGISNTRGQVSATTNGQTSACPQKERDRHPRRRQKKGFRASPWFPKFHTSTPTGGWQSAGKDRN